jgi:hypothetical protein
MNMGKCNRRENNRLWTKEEMMAYLDWDTAENVRVDGIVREDIEANGARTSTRGPGYLWAQVDRDIEGQNHR